MLAKALNINPDRIAVTELFGAIPSSAKTAEYVRMLKAIEENAHIRAMVIDIDCPGGGASASEYLYRAVAKVKAKKPVVAFVRGTGASGGYMVGCAATKLLAAPMAIVGSIGVISMRPMLQELLTKIGVRMEVTKSGRLKDMFSNFREPTDEERVKEQAPSIRSTTASSKSSPKRVAWRLNGCASSLLARSTPRRRQSRTASSTRWATLMRRSTSRSPWPGWPNGRLPTPDPTAASASACWRTPPPASRAVAHW
jgi:signal peptide peptidase SppA